MIIRPQGTAFHVIMMVAATPEYFQDTTRLTLSLVWNWSRVAESWQGRLSNVFDKATNY